MGINFNKSVHESIADDLSGPEAMAQTVYKAKEPYKSDHMADSIALES